MADDPKEQAELEDDDAELQDLLVDLTEDDGVISDESVTINKSVEESEKVELDIVISESEPESGDMTQIVSTKTELVDPSAAADEIIDIRKFVIEHNRDYNAALSNLKSDRAKADSLVQILMQKLQDGEASNTETETLVKGIEVLSRSADSMVRLLDSKTKLVTSTKAQTKALIQQNFGGGTSDALQKILNQTEEHDDV